MTQLRISLGKKGESLVAEYLKQQGFTLLAQNYSQACGEIDIIAQKSSVIAFIEVKLRTNHYYTIADLIPASKQKKIIKTAQYFIAQHFSYTDYVYRFDVAFLEPLGDDYTISYIPNAFTKPSY